LSLIIEGDLGVVVLGGVWNNVLGIVLLAFCLVLLDVIGWSYDFKGCQRFTTRGVVTKSVERTSLVYRRVAHMLQLGQ
jgi:hypothetical protein